MKNRKNKNIFKFGLAAVILGITVAGGIFALQVQATRNATTLPDVFYSEGASVRVTENERLAQMRFHIALENSNENYKKWFEGTKAKKGVETGIICMPYDEYQLHVTEQCKFQLENITKLGAAKTITTNSWEKGSKKIVSYAYLNAADIPTTGEIPYNQEMIVRGYIKDKAGVVYTEPIVASMSDVAYQSQNANVKTLSATQKAIVKETYMKDHAITIIPLTGAEKVGNYRYGTSFSSILNAVFFTDAKRTQVFSDSYVTDDTVLYSATQAECNLGLDQLDGITYDEATKGVSVVGNTQIFVKDDWFSAQVQGVEGVHDFELSVTFGAMEQYTANGDNGFIGIELKNADDKNQYFELIENNKNVYKARTRGAYENENGWTSQKVTDEVTITLRRVGKQYTMSYGGETWEISSSEFEKKYATTAIADLRIYACITKGITIKDWKFTNLDEDSTVVSEGLAFYAMYTKNAMDEGAYSIGVSNGDWSANLKNAKAQKDFVVSWNMKSAQKANNANGIVGIRLTNPDTDKSVWFSLQHAYDNAGRAYIYSDSMNYIKGNLHSYKASSFSAAQWNIKLVRKADAFYLTLNGENLWAGKATRMMNEVMIGDILGETVDIGFETKDWNAQNVTWSVSTNETDINAAIPELTIEEGLVFYPMYNVLPLNPSSYAVEENQIKVSDDWFSAQILDANGIKDFELSVTFSGMTNYKTNGNNGRIGISFKNNLDENIEFDMYETNEDHYYARMVGAFSQEKGKTNQPVADEITIKLRRVGQHYTMTYGTESWSFYASKVAAATGTMKEQFAITEIHDLRFYAAITHGITVKDWNFTNLDGAPKSIDEGLAFYCHGNTIPLNAEGYIIENDQIKVNDDWFTAQVVDAEGVKDFEISTTYSNLAGRPYGRFGFWLGQDGVSQEITLEKVDNKTYQLNLQGAYTFNPDVQLSSDTDIESLTVTLKRVGKVYTLTGEAGDSKAVWEFEASDKLNGTNTFESKFATKELVDFRIAPVNFGRWNNPANTIMLESWNFMNLDAPKTIDKGLVFYCYGNTNQLDPEAYRIENNRIVVNDDWFTAQVEEARNVEDFEITATFSNLVGRPCGRFGFWLGQDGEAQEITLEKVDNKTYKFKLQGAYSYDSNVQLASDTDINKLTVTLKRVGEVYTLTGEAENRKAVWKFRASDKLDGANTFKSKFATKEMTDLRIAPVNFGRWQHSINRITIDSWSFTNLEGVHQPIEEGLAFYCHGNTIPMNAGTYIIENGQIKVKDDWFTAQVIEAKNVKDFEISVTYSNLVGKPSGRFGFWLGQDGAAQEITLEKVDNKTYKFKLQGAYSYDSNVQLASDTDIKKLTVTLKRVGKVYTLTGEAGDSKAVWEFEASDKLNGTNTFESKFATKELVDFRIAPVNFGVWTDSTRTVTIESWSFMNLGAPAKTIDEGLAFYCHGNTIPMNAGTYIIENGQIKVNDDWFTAQVKEARNVEDFEIAATFSNLVGRPIGRFGFWLGQDEVSQEITLEKVDDKTYQLKLLGVYTINSDVQLSSDTDINKLTVTLKRVGEVYTLTGDAGNSKAVWTFKASDKLDGTNAFESKFATKKLVDLRIAPVNFGRWNNPDNTITIESWSFMNLDNQ